jgi:hypothetical protein
MIAQRDSAHGQIGSYVASFGDDVDVIWTVRATVMPSAHPASTSLGQCTPSTRRLMPTAPASRTARAR